MVLNGKMPVVRGPIEDCEYRTLDLDPMVAAALITTHATVHGLPHSAAPVAKAEKVKRPCISSAGTRRIGNTSHPDGVTTWRQPSYRGLIK